VSARIYSKWLIVNNRPV